MKNKDSKAMLIKLSAATLLAMAPFGTVSAQTLNCGGSSLIFGSITPCGSPGTVTIRPDGSQTSSCVSASVPFVAANCIATPGGFPVPMRISITAPTFTINNGGASMDVNDFNIITNANGPTATVTTFFTSFRIGATLNVGAAQAGGTYTGSFIVSVIFP